MSYQVLARKWRPKTFAELIGQPHVVQALVNGITNGRLHHAFLFTGTRGVGKTTIARILARCLNCEKGETAEPCGECNACVDIDEGRFIDLLEIDAASKTKVDDTRDLLDNVQYMPTIGRYKIYLIDEVHMLSTASFNALLKTLEEPPAHVKFILATTDPQKIPVTILSRCLQFNLMNLEPQAIADYLSSVLQSEELPFEEEAIVALARAADGSMRDALSLLDQALAFGAGKVSTDDVRVMLGHVGASHVWKILNALAGDSSAELIEAMDDLGRLACNYDRLLQQIAEIFHQVAWVQQLPDYSNERYPDWENVRGLAAALDPEDTQLFYQIALQGRRDLMLAPDPRSGAEMALLRMFAFRPETSSGEADAGPAAKSPAKTMPDGDKPDHVKPQAAKSQGSTTHKSKPGTPSQQAIKSSVAPDDGDARQLTADRPIRQAGKRPSAEQNAQTRSADTVTASDPLDISVGWEQVVGKLPLRGMTRELARNIKPGKREGAVWYFDVPEHAQHLATSRSTEQLGSVLSQALNEPGLKVSLKASTGNLTTPAVLEEMDAKRRLSDAEINIQQDPTVQSLLDQLDARIIADTIEPIQ